MLELIDIHKTYEGRPLLNGVSLRVTAGETVCLLGPSGSGKSTLLRIIAGLEQAESGRLLWGGEDLASVPAHRRGFGLVFQDYALFPHLTVRENVAFGLRMQKRARAEIQARVDAMLAAVNLPGFGGRRVTELSGGEQQRVALARALAPEPRLLLFDEPLGALDRALRESLLADLRALLRRQRVPAIYVTHDQEEAFAIADRLLLLHEGRIVQDGSPADVHARPASAWVARFLALGSLVPARALGDGRFAIAGGVITVRCDHAHAAGEQVTLLIRPDAYADGADLTVRVEECLFQGGRWRARFAEGWGVDLPAGVEPGREVRLSLRTDAVQCLGAGAE